MTLLDRTHYLLRDLQESIDKQYQKTDTEALAAVGTRAVVLGAAAIALARMGMAVMDVLEKDINTVQSELEKRVNAK